MATPQNEAGWATGGTRQWMAIITGAGQLVVVRHCTLPPVDGDYPETWELSWSEWVRDHESVYGLTLDGSLLADDADRRAAWRKIRRMANGNSTYTEVNVRDAFGAVKRLLRDLTQEIQDS
jgi:hypothetical protein